MKRNCGGPLRPDSSVRATGNCRLVMRLRRGDVWGTLSVIERVEQFIDEERARLADAAIEGSPEAEPDADEGTPAPVVI